MIDAARTFERVVAGVDGSGESVEACRQAARLVDPEGLLELVTVCDPAGSDQPAWAATDRQAEDRLDGHHGSARAALTLAGLVAGPDARTSMLTGEPARSLLREVARVGATLVVVGACGHDSVSEAVLGGVASDLLEQAPCAVLLSRPGSDPGRTFRRIVARCDGSAGSARARAVAAVLQRRFSGSLRLLEDPVRRERFREYLDPASPGSADEQCAAALIAASESADLVVVGGWSHRRGDTLRTVPDLVAHRAASSVLLIR